jgi:hypothetical protein
VFAAPGLGPGALLSVGCAFTGGPMGISWSVDGEGRAWAAAAAGPLYTAPPGSWNRGPSSAELFAYPSMTGPRGAGVGIPLDGTALVYATYLAAGTDFSARWLLRRPVAFMQSVDAAAPPPAALAALSLWATAGAGCTAAARAWATTGPVVPASGFAIVAAIIALLPTSPLGLFLAPLIECALPQGGAALTLTGECGAAGSPLAGGTVNRTSGWVADSAAHASALGWGNVTRAGAAAGAEFWAATPAALWRCTCGGGGGAFSAALGSPAACEATLGAGWLPDVQLGWALGPLSAASAQ